MQMIGRIVAGKLGAPAVNGEATFADPVGEAADGGAEIFAVAGRVMLGVGGADDQRMGKSVEVNGPDRCAGCCDLGAEAAGGNRHELAHRHCPFRCRKPAIAE